MINNSEKITKKCSCTSPKWEIIRKECVRGGKNFGKIKYLVYCRNCKAQWKTMSEKGLENLL